jgi:hypothetical protein
MRLGHLGVLADAIDEAFDDIGGEDGRVILAQWRDGDFLEGGGFVHGLSV